MLRRSLLLGAAMFGALAASAASQAATAQSMQPAWISPPSHRSERVQSRVRPVREIVEIVRRQRGGELVDVLRLEQSADPPFYVLRWRYPNGVVADLRVNAVTGQVM